MKRCRYLDLDLRQCIYEEHSAGKCEFDESTESRSPTRMVVTNVTIDPDRLAYHHNRSLDEAVCLVGGDRLNCYLYLDQIEPGDEVLYQPFVVFEAYGERRSPISTTNVFRKAAEAQDWARACFNGFVAGWEARGR